MKAEITISIKCDGTEFVAGADADVREATATECGVLYGKLFQVFMQAVQGRGKEFGRTSGPDATFRFMLGFDSAARSDEPIVDSESYWTEEVGRRGRHAD